MVIKDIHQGKINSTRMDCIDAIRHYIDIVVDNEKVPGMKVLLLDEETTNMISMVYSQSKILDKEVYLVERLDAKHEPMMHLRAVCLLRPTPDNLENLKRELSEPKYAEYHLFFTNIVGEEYLRCIAEADLNDVVKQVQEVYADYSAINEDLFTLNIPNSLQLSSNVNQTSQTEQLKKRMLTRNVQGILAVLLSFKKQPNQIRYQGSSYLAQTIAHDVKSAIDKDGIFDFRRNSPNEGPTLLILDRRDDPVSPLLTQYTYQAMIHELLGLNNNRCSLKGAPNVTKDLEEIVLSPTEDEFFKKNRHLEFAEVCHNVKQLLDDYQQQSKLNEYIKSIEDMQTFLERYPAFRAQSINVSKHVAIMTELLRLAESFKLPEVLHFEQELACDDDQSRHHKELLSKIADPLIRPEDKVRLCLLYALRYEEIVQIGVIKQHLQTAGVIPDLIYQLDAIINYAGIQRRAPGLYGDRSVLSRFSRRVTATIMEGIQNMDCQHVPLLMNTIEAVVKGKLKESHYPAVGRLLPGKQSEVIVFIVGGATYEEAQKVAELNAGNTGVNVILGGSFIHNTTSFISNVRKHFSSL